MGLSQFEYVEGLHSTTQTFGLIAILLLLPFVVSFVATSWVTRKPGFKFGRPSQRLSRVPFLRKQSCTRLLVLAALPALILVDLDRRLLNELLQLPFGGLLAFWVAAAGLLFGFVACFGRLAPKRLLIAGGVAALATVLGGFAFSAQFPDPVEVNVERPEIAAEQPTRTAQPQAPQATQTETAAPTGPVLPPAPPAVPAPTGIYDPSRLQLPTGSLQTTPICAVGMGSDPVSVRINSLGSIVVTRHDRTEVTLDTVEELRQCPSLGTTGADAGPVYRKAPGASIVKFDGTRYAVVGNQPVGVVAEVSSGGGDRYALVYRIVDRVEHVGLIHADFLS